MQLVVKPAITNQYPLKALFIRGGDVKLWLREIQAMGLSLLEVDVYALPGTSANTVWGCLLVPLKGLAAVETGIHVRSQLVGECLFIPAYSTIYPVVTPTEVNVLLKMQLHCWHPEIGITELEQPVQFSQLLAMPQLSQQQIVQPAKGVHLPALIQSYQVKEVAAEEVLQKMEEQLFPESKSLENKPLGIWEKIKLWILRLLLRGGMPSAGGSAGLSGWRLKIANWLAGKTNGKWLQKMQQSLENLEQRNQRQLDRLLDMLKNDPDTALQYAIPLDPDGAGRGSKLMEWDLGKRWFDFGLGKGSSSGVGGSFGFTDNSFKRLEDQYRATALELMKQQQYEKAAFVYLKLLKDHFQAAKALEEGKLYAEAAALYLKHGNHLAEAARCYENGNMTLKAIELYAQLGMHEKAGDLYRSIGQKEDAVYHYGKVADDYIQGKRYSKAADIYQHKIQDMAQAQNLLLEGWRAYKGDARNCLDKYLTNIGEERLVMNAIDNIYMRETNERNKPAFLDVLKGSYTKYPELSAPIKDIAYEIIAEYIEGQPAMAEELQHFNKEDHNLTKDILLYKQMRR
ncbi:Soluble NSF attachment protein, SNAP [Filimonas lacunae]|uniref:Soluble NSF attachment protein, SNAP n=1 Tax=Filimonas lacunae TaxID=477680 RepID=A0A173MKR3_9BACT|nr:hypothetical protein [Filimonas lacunae]BAV07988.1 hypothetical protein FLA_4021 [Filimonas lacunae]SIT07528.1 Soluble NSF attachment protein, SNAP [Filimonas lacunae]